MRFRGWWSHSQNLNDKPGNRQGSMWRHGRAWLRKSDSRKSVGVEWAFSSRPRTLGWRVERGARGSEHDFALSLHFAFLSLYLHTEGLMPAWWLVDGYNDREYGLSYSFEGDHLTWRWHAKVWESSSRDPWWMSKGWFLRDVLFGRAKCTCEVLSEEQVLIPMPEKSYPATVKLELARWKRPRWPFARELQRAEIDIPGGVPHPGKGENSWDCGEDGIYGMTCPAKTVEAAIARVVESSLRDRRRYGGRSWKPATA